MTNVTAIQTPKSTRIQRERATRLVVSRMRAEIDETARTIFVRHLAQFAVANPSGHTGTYLKAFEKAWQQGRHVGEAEGAGCELREVARIVQPYVQEVVNG